jgi:WhiB family transcriptional regulator, redox-sensing transcriptional regulator
MERIDAGVELVDPAVVETSAVSVVAIRAAEPATTVRPVPESGHGSPGDDREAASTYPRPVSVFAGPDSAVGNLGLGDVFGEPPEWQERALCAQTDPEAFFPEKGGSTREAKKICLGCEVRAECLEYALAHDERFGIWGGMSERERRRYRRRAV